MSLILENIARIVCNKNDPAVHESIDYRSLLKDYNLKFKEEDYYLQIGETMLIQGWILHLSVIRIQVFQLLETILPELINEQVSFKIPRDKEIVKYLLDGSLGHTKLAKVITIYPNSELKAVSLAKSLINLTKEFRGPAIITDYLLGNIVYTRYGAINPIIKKDNADNYIKYIYDNNGSLIEDSCTIPFKLTSGIEWPFNDITEISIPLQKKLLNNKYRPLEIIKPDFKGSVVKGNFFKNLFAIQLCLIKQGIKNMWADEYGRDMFDRLIWQYNLYNDLKESIPLPQIFELFQEDNNIYLVMEFIKGESLGGKISGIYKDNSWFQLSQTEKLSLVNYLFKILTVIEKLHNKGYIHRDITHSNFLINKRDNIFLIDMELSYCSITKKPDPAFKLGTPGYMSPQQREHNLPTIKEDIYALGALMILFFTGLSPIKINTTDEDDIYQHLKFFTESPEIVKLIVQCLGINPDERPSLNHIKIIIEEYRSELKDLCCSEITPNSIEPNQEVLTNIINTAIKGLCNPKVLSADNLWTSLLKNDVSGMQPVERVPLIGFHTGISGILYLLARAHKKGYEIKNCLPGYHESWKHIEMNYMNGRSFVTSGLYDGLGGIAIALNEGIEGKLLSKNPYSTYLQKCFEPITKDFDIASGLAGQGMALLQCENLLDPHFFKSTLTIQVDTIICHQQNDGSWNILRSDGQKGDKILGLAYGISGILYFLLESSKNRNVKMLKHSIEKGLQWLVKNAQKEKGFLYWNTTLKSKSVDLLSTSTGVPGIALTFIKAYEVLKMPLYREIAENILKNIPSQPIYNDFSQSSGLAGLGEVYLEANRIFKTKEWGNRIHWIVNLYMNTFLTYKNDGGYWSVDIYPDSEPDLMIGTSGIIHFLMRFQTADELSSISSEDTN